MVKWQMLQITLQNIAKKLNKNIASLAMGARQSQVLGNTKKAHLEQRKHKALTPEQLELRASSKSGAAEQKPLDFNYYNASQKIARLVGASGAHDET